MPLMGETKTRRAYVDHYVGQHAIVSKIYLSFYRQIPVVLGQSKNFYLMLLTFKWSLLFSFFLPL